MEAEEEDKPSLPCDPIADKDDDNGKGTLIDNAKLSGCVNDERTRNVPCGSCWCRGEVSDKTSFTISL